MTVGMSCKNLEIQTLENRWFSYLVGTFLQVILFFVLTKGMSLIGLRPERPAFCQEFEKRIHGWDYRTLVRPGLSGLAQVTGGYDLLPKEKVVLDLWNLGCADNPQLLRLASSGVAC